MSDRKPGESFEDFVKRRVWESGSFWSPNVPEGHDLSFNDLPKMNLTDPVVVAAMIEMTKMDAGEYTKHTMRHHGRTPNFDGVAGPALHSMLEEGGRCPVPDFAPPPGVEPAYEDPAVQEIALRMRDRQDRSVMAAVGNGNWPGCHGVGNFHSCAVKVNTSGVHQRVAPLLKQILMNVQKAYASIGMLMRFIGMDNEDMLTGAAFSGQINTSVKFVPSSAGWIGLAIVGQGERCDTPPIWMQFLASYLGGNADAEIINQQVTLWKHEFGHNSGFGHEPDGVMRSYIKNGLPLDIWPETDPFTAKLKRAYGGVPVPIPGGDPTPGPVPVPPQDIARQLFEIQVKNATQDAAIEYFAARTNSIDERLRVLERMDTTQN